MNLSEEKRVQARLTDEAILVACARQALYDERKALLSEDRSPRELRSGGDGATTPTKGTSVPRATNTVDGDIALGVVASASQDDREHMSETESRLGSVLSSPGSEMRARRNQNVRRYSAASVDEEMAVSHGEYHGCVCELLSGLLFDAFLDTVTASWSMYWCFCSIQQSA
jgi:hypothetical protein